jgi:hypothetical protein
VKTTVTWIEEDMVFGSMTPVMNLFDESKVRPDPLVDGRLLVVPCVAWRLLPLLSRHSLTSDPVSVNVETSSASNHATMPLMFFGVKPVALGRSNLGDMLIECLYRGDVVPSVGRIGAGLRACPWL